MASIIKTLQEKYGENFHKIDANDPDQNETVHPEKTNYLKQASVSSVLAAMGDYTGASHAPELPPATNEESLNTIFKNNLPTVQSAIAKYAADTEEHVHRYLLKTYARIKEAVDEAVGTNPKDVQQAFHEQADEILGYLPASLGISDILHHQGIDDRTHKMDGILSSFTKLLGKFLDPPSKSDGDNAQST